MVHKSRVNERQEGAMSGPDVLATIMTSEEASFLDFFEFRQQMRMGGRLSYRH
jgi:hypothetical protein